VNSKRLSINNIKSGSIGIISRRNKETAVPCPYSIIFGRDTALPSPLYHSGTTGIDIIGKYLPMLAPVVFVLGGLSIILACCGGGQIDRLVLWLDRECCSRQICVTPRGIRPESLGDG
jgi:hypothetical protein